MIGIRPLRITCMLLGCHLVVLWHNDLEYEKISNDNFFIRSGETLRDFARELVLIGSRRNAE